MLWQMNDNFKIATLHRTFSHITESNDHSTSCNRVFWRWLEGLLGGSEEEIEVGTKQAENGS